MQQNVIQFTCDDFEVVVRTTDDLRYSWQRFCGRVNTTDGNSARSYCRYASSRECTLMLYDIENHTHVEEGKSTEWCGLWPVMFETNAYQICIKFDEGISDFKILHIRKNVTDGFYVDDRKLVGNVDFLNNPGLFRLEFEYWKDRQRQTAYVTFEVCSPKLDTRHDYKSILREVNDEYENIIYRYLATTMQQFSRGRIRNDATWMQAFEQVVEDYLKNVRFIAANPNIKIRTHTLFRRADHIKHWQPQMEERYAEAEAMKQHEELYFGYEEYENSIDTLENRFVKHTLTSMGDKLKTVIHKVLSNSIEEVSEDYRKKWKRYQEEIVKLQKHPFFKSVGRFSGMSGESLVLQNRQGYRQIYKDWLKLRRGIDLYDGAKSIGTLQIWEIYELWCFVKMKHLVRDVLGIHTDMPDYSKLLDEPKETFLNPFTDSKLEHVVKYYYPTPEPEDHSEKAEQLRIHAGDSITLHYQHTFNRTGVQDKEGIRTATTEQRPDIVLNIRKANGEIVLTYLYDAKYRVISDVQLDKDFAEEDKAEQEYFKGGDYPPSDAINQMHRYRDAIYYGSDHDRYAAKEVIGGYILFPGRGDDETLSKRYFSQSIKSVNIGAFPLLPNLNKEKEGRILRQHLEEILLKKSTAIEHIEKSIPQRGLKYQTEEKSADELVIIGLTSKMDWCIENKMYPLPLEKAYQDPRFFQATYIVVHDNRNSRLMHINRGEIAIKSKNDMQEMGYPDPSKEQYLLFTLTSQGDYINTSITLDRLGAKKKQGVFVVEMKEVII